MNKTIISLFTFIFIVLLLSFVSAHDFSNELQDFKKITPDRLTIELGNYHFLNELPNYIAIWTPGQAKAVTSFNPIVFNADGTALRNCGKDKVNCLDSLQIFYENNQRYDCNINTENMLSEGKSICKIEDTPSPGKYKLFFSYMFYNSDGQGLGSEIYFDVIVLGCGDSICDTTESENSNNCCSDCGSIPLYKCENNNLNPTCGNGLCETMYQEDKSNCCSDCGCSSKYFECGENKCVQYPFFKRLSIWFKNLF